MKSIRKRDRHCVIEIDINTVKQARNGRRMKNGRATGPGDIPIELIKSGGQKLLEMTPYFLIRL
jgi:hypothetical protein